MRQEVTFLQADDVFLIPFFHSRPIRGKSGALPFGFRKDLVVQLKT
jgi:hypothetical protein